MSAGAPEAAGDGGASFSWLPERLRPRASELPGTGSLRLVETTLLIILAVFLAIVTIYDLHRETKINQRLSADETTWRRYTGHDYVNLSVDTVLLGIRSEREVVCGNISPGAPGARTQICLEIAGPVHGGLRAVQGGGYQPRRTPHVKARRYRCFGHISPGICPR